jgi:hypothetical protein
VSFGGKNWITLESLRYYTAIRTTANIFLGGGAAIGTVVFNDDENVASATAVSVDSPDAWRGIVIWRDNSDTMLSVESYGQPRKGFVVKGSGTAIIDSFYKYPQ